MNFALGPDEKLWESLSCCGISPVYQRMSVFRRERTTYAFFSTVMHEVTTSGSRHTHQVTWHTVARSVYAPGWASHCCMYTPDLLSRCTSVIHTSHITAPCHPRSLCPSRTSLPSHQSICVAAFSTSLKKQKNKTKDGNLFLLTHPSHIVWSFHWLTALWQLRPFVFPRLWRRLETKGMRRKARNEKIY